MTFRDFHFEPSLQEGLDSMGFEDPTPIQQQAIPIILSNKDLIACAQTGTGKTAAFILPILNKLTRSHSPHTDTLIIVPTRELALQIDQALQGFSYFTPVSSLAIYGGNDGISFEAEKRALTDGANIIIATPGRLMAHLNMGYVKFDGLRHLILDEADKMLDMGFVDDILKINTHLPALKQTLMFSATMPPKIRALAARLLKHPEQINIAVSKPAAGVKQGVYFADDVQKGKLLLTVLDGNKFSSILIFASTKQKVKDLERELKHSGTRVKAIHSDLEQMQREEVLRSFKNRQTQVLVATDILSRGIDIEDIGLVVNYDVPDDAEDYIHRIGRTARAESTGEAITLVSRKDARKFQRIEDFIGSKVNRLPLPDSIVQQAASHPEEPRQHKQRKHRHKRPSFRKRT